MSDFSWDDHPEEKGSFDWDAHPVDKTAPIRMDKSALGAALVGNPLAEGLAEKISHPAETARDVVFDPDPLTYKETVEGAKGAFSEDPRLQAIREKIMSRNMAMAAGTLNLAPAAPATALASKAGGAVREGLESAATGAEESALGWGAKALGANQQLLNKLGRDKVRGAVRYTLDEGVISPLASAETMAARNEAKGAEGGKMMGDVYEAIDSKGASTFNPQTVKNKVAEELEPNYRTPINKGEWGQLDNTLESIAARGTDNISMKEAQALKKEIASVAYPRGAVGTTPKQLMAQDAYRVINKSIDEAADAGSEIIGVQGLKELLQKGKKLYGNAETTDKLLSKRLNREEGNHLFGLTDYVLGSAEHAGGLGFPKTAATVGVKKAASKYGPATAAVGLDKASKLLKSGSESLGKYGPVLEKAAARGESAFLTTHAMLMQEPEYRQIIEESQ